MFATVVRLRFSRAERQNTQKAVFAYLSKRRVPVEGHRSHTLAKVGRCADQSLQRPRGRERVSSFAAALRAARKKGEGWSHGYPL